MTLNSFLSNLWILFLFNSFDMLFELFDLNNLYIYYIVVKSIIIQLHFFNDVCNQLLLK